MKTKHIFWGLLFLTLGLLFLASNITSLYLDWGSISKLWPLLIILFGVSFLIPKEPVKVIITIVGSILLALIVFSIFSQGRKEICHAFWNDHNHKRKASEKISFDLPDSGITKGYLDLSISAAEIKIKNSDDKLAEIFSTFDNDFYTISDKKENGNFYLTVNQNDIDDNLKQIVNWGEENKINLFLYNNLPWNLNLEFNASDVDLDLSRLIIDSLWLDLNAANGEIDLSKKSKNSYVVITGNASNIELNIPKDAGCEIIIDGNLSARSFDDFIEVENNLYRSENYDNYEKKIKLKIDINLSNLEINRVKR